MPDLLQTATSGRAKCRGCGRAIAKGELRFGESLPNPYREGEAVYWFHVVCAACMRPEKLLDALKTSSEPIPDYDRLEQTARVGTQHYRLPRICRVERSPSARARCRLCRDLIDKSVWRVALQMFEEGRMSPIGYIHLGCSEAYFGTRAILDRLTRLTPELGETEMREIERALEEQRRAPGERAELLPAELSETEMREIERALEEQRRAPGERAELVPAQAPMPLAKTHPGDTARPSVAKAAPNSEPEERRSAKR